MVSRCRISKTLIGAFKEVEVKMIHLSTAMMDFTEEFADGKTLHQLVRKYWNRVIIGVDNNKSGRTIFYHISHAKVTNPCV
jgi:hypothetical protein